MKHLILILTLTLASQTFATDLTLKNLAGTYKLSHPEIPVENTVILKATGAITMIEKSTQGKFTCKGQARLLNVFLVSEVTCPNGIKFEQTVNLDGVSDFTKFQAEVQSSLYGTKVEMTFEKIK